MATTGVVLAAVYLLWAYQQVFHGKPTTPSRSASKRSTVAERLVMAPLVIAIVFLGIYPRPVLDRITPSVDQLVTHVEQVAHIGRPCSGQAVSTLGQPHRRAERRARMTLAAASSPRRSPSRTSTTRRSCPS